MCDPERIPVRRYGTHGPHLVVLHGGPGAPGSAAGLAHALAPDFQVFEPLQRRSGTVPLTVAQHVDDLAHVAPNPAIIVGWSFGAMLGLSYAAQFPEAVSALVLVSCGTYDDASRTLFRAARDRRLGAAGRQRIDELKRRLAAQHDAAHRDALLEQIGAAYMQAEYFEEDAAAYRDEADALATDAAGHDETWRDVLRLQRDGIEPAAFRRITAPVLMVHGDSDPHPGAATRDVLRTVVPQLEYVELERCGHTPWRERFARAEFGAVVRDWCLRAARA